jgi:biopolymer transport protein ExbB
MFEGKNLWEIFNLGGFTMYILLFCSILSIAVIIERWINYNIKSRIKREKFMYEVRQSIRKGDIENILKSAKKLNSPITNVVYAGLKLFGTTRQEISSAMEREIIIETLKLEKYTSIVGTIGNIAVYIGLFGTVIGIIRSFHNISVVGTGGMSVVIGGISEALICTASGLLVAVPSVVAYNYFVKTIDNFVNDMELTASELLDLIGNEKK